MPTIPLLVQSEDFCLRAGLTVRLSCRVGAGSAAPVVMVLVAGMGCCAGPAIRVPIRGKHLRGWRRRHNRDHAKIRSLGERAMAVLKGWRLLRKVRCGTNRSTDFVKAVLVLHYAST